VGGRGLLFQFSTHSTGHAPPDKENKRLRSNGVSNNTPDAALFLLSPIPWLLAWQAVSLAGYVL